MEADGLSTTEVEERRARGQVNEVVERTSRSFEEIVRANVLTRFNAILGVIAAFGFAASPLALAAIPVVFLTGLCFAALGLIMTALAPSYDFFMYYFTLFITPMMLLSGVFFPVEQLPAAVQAVATVLPLNHAVELVRPLLLGRTPEHVVLHCGVLLGVALVGYHVALALCRKRMIK